MKYYYFVSFRYNKNFYEGWANSEMHLDYEIDNFDDITKLENKLCLGGSYDMVVIINYQLLRTEEE